MKKSKLVYVLLMIPFFLIMTVFLLSLVDGVLQGFGYIPAFGLEEFTMEYFQMVFSSPNLPKSIGISLYVASVSAMMATALAVLLSFALVNTKKDRGVLYAVIRVPMFVPWVVTGLMMIHLLSGGGWLARLVSELGLGAFARAFEHVLYSPGQAGIIIAFVWACTPFACFLIQTVMSRVTDTMSEAAANLGAGLWRRFWNVTLPLCRPVISNSFLILLVSCFGSFEIPTMLGMTMPRALPVEIYYQCTNQSLANRPYAMALNSIMLVLALVLTGAVLMVGRLSRRREAYHED